MEGEELTKGCCGLPASDMAPKAPVGDGPWPRRCTSKNQSREDLSETLSILCVMRSGRRKTMPTAGSPHSLSVYCPASIRAATRDLCVSIGHPALGSLHKAAGDEAIEWRAPTRGQRTP